MTEFDASPAPRVGGPSAGADGGGAAEDGALADVRRHARQAWSALRACVEQAGLGAQRALMRALFVAAALGSAIVIGWAGLSRLIDGVAAGLAQYLGSAWRADIVVGATCLAVAASVVAAVALSARRQRRTRTRADRAAAPARTASGDGLTQRNVEAASSAAAERGLADALSALGDDAARALDLRAHIARHPVAAHASAFALGLAAGVAACEGRRPPAPTARGPIAAAVPPPPATPTSPTSPARGWMRQVIEDVLLPMAAAALQETTRRADETTGRADEPVPPRSTVAATPDASRV